MYRMQCVKVDTLISGEIDSIHLKALLLAHKDKPAAPRISFKKSIGSISISGHKFLGCPIPCGILMTRLEHTKALSRDIQIIASRDATITGSRCGHAPIFLWYGLQERGLKGIEKEVQKCILNARHLLNQLRDRGIGAMLNEFSNTVVFERPLDDDFTRKWNLACEGNIAHVVVMQHTTIEILDTFVVEFVQKRLISFTDGQRMPPCIADDIGAENCAYIAGSITGPQVRSS
ncbi:hypothetical protein Fmac_023678 [Flemingia macrophylla]|uniref:Serine decarboxylase n=1 Tax=Flemingia macrophylla TaxID=520843 RepID=A0ABD1LNT1_9FABA